MAKKTNKQDMKCMSGHKGFCHCKAIMTILIIVLVWLPSIALIWSKVVITIAAAIILLSGHFCYCKHKEH